MLEEHQKIGVQQREGFASAWLGKWKRRAVSIPMYGLMWLMVTALSPLILPALMVFDLMTGDMRLPRMRAMLFFILYLSVENAGLAVSALLWLCSGACIGVNQKQYIEWNYALQRWWSGALWKGSVKLFSLKVKVENPPEGLQGPILLFMRHASTADTVIPANMVANSHGIRLRYVIKKELLWDVCLDVVGHRIPNVFIDRGSPDPGREIQAIQELAHDIKAGEGIIIYPEGTRFHPKKLERRLQELRRKGKNDLLHIARNFEYVLPPRLGGPLALMSAAPDADVVIGSHTGFEGAARFQDFWQGGLIDKTIHVRFQRFSRGDMPETKQQRALWLYKCWEEIDRWIASVNAL